MNKEPSHHGLEKNSAAYWAERAQSLLEEEQGNYSSDKDQMLAVLKQSENFPGRVLEIGCGSGERLRAFQDNGCDVTGVDVAQTFLDHTHKEQQISRDKLIKHDLRSGPLPVKDASYDFVIAARTLFYIKNQIQIIEDAVRALKKSGIALCDIIVQAQDKLEAPLNTSPLWDENTYFYALDEAALINRLSAIKDLRLATIVRKYDLQEYPTATSAILVLQKT